LTLKQDLKDWRAAARADNPAAREQLDRYFEQQQESRVAAAAFIAACKRRDPTRFHKAAAALIDTDGGWAKALKQVPHLKRVSPRIQWAFLQVWVESKGLRVDVPWLTMLKALRVLLPRTRRRAPIRVFRGASAGELKRRRAYGFSWSTKRDIADKFAQDYRNRQGGSVLLETLAPPDAILHVREQIKEHHDEGEFVIPPELLSRVKVIDYDEGECIIDPTRLSRVEVIACYLQQERV
jgi:hypothetical protein